MKPTIDNLIKAVLVLKEAQDNVDRIKQSLANAHSPAKPKPVVHSAKPDPVKSYSISIEAIADVFGGFTQLAEVLKTPLSTLHGWHRRRRIPHYRHKAIRDAARAAGIDLSLLPRQPNRNGLPVSRAIEALRPAPPVMPQPNEPEGNSLDSAEHL